MPAATARLNMRLPSATQQLIQEAASAQGVDVTSFVLDAASARARRVLLEERALRVSAHEAGQIAELLRDAPLPNDGLLAAADRLADSGN